MEGLVLRGIGSFYTVLLPDGELLTCKARGRFRKDRISPLPGDRVEAARDEEGENGYLLEILPRRNSLIRPAVANIDQLLIVLAMSAPKPDLLLTDKLILQCELLGIRPVLALNKCDAAEDAAYIESFCAQYAPTGYPVYRISAATGEGVDALKEQLKGQITCLAGQSAVGKTSLINRLLPGMDLPVGDLAAKTDRGRHTTRHAELWELPDGGYIVDTPGFSLLDPSELEPEELSALYPEMRELRQECRFPGCLHASEPDCMVKEALSEGKLSEGRYERYLVLLEYFKEMRKHRYD
ncbi:MAG: ribosome small subunit-dependent GTPase A [Clostridia bacterium]|nr:ribosome small subunit-dependent GTPase A [Clostridia bacterium]MBR0026607.1 ribosome small subunit-dependent GTPase A [Clostridia bacterium]